MLIYNLPLPSKFKKTSITCPSQATNSLPPPHMSNLSSMFIRRCKPSPDGQIRPVLRKRYTVRPYLVCICWASSSTRRACLLYAHGECITLSNAACDGDVVAHRVVSCQGPVAAVAIRALRSLGKSRCHVSAYECWLIAHCGALIPKLYIGAGRDNEAKNIVQDTLMEYLMETL